MSRDDSRNDDFAADDNKTTLCLLIIDMINEFKFPEAEHMFPEVLSVAERITELKVRLRYALGAFADIRWCAQANHYGNSH